MNENFREFLDRLRTGRERFERIAHACVERANSE